MRHGNRVYVPDLRSRQPRRGIGGDPDAHQFGLVPRDAVEGQCRAVHIGIQNAPEGDKSQLDQRLEPVADAAHQTVPLVQQVTDTFPDGGIAQECHDELTGAVRLISAGKAAGNEHDLGLLQLVRKGFNAPRDAVRSQVIDNKDVRLGTRRAHRTGGIILTVGAGKHGNQHARRCACDGGSRRLSAGRGDRIRSRGCFARLHGEYAFQPSFIEGIQIRQLHCLATPDHASVVRDRSDRARTRNIRVRINLQKQRPDGKAEQIGQRQTVIKGKAQPVADTHFVHSLDNAAEGWRIGGVHLARTHHARGGIPDGQQGLRDGQTVFADLRAEPDQSVSCGLDVVGHDVGHPSGGDGKGDQCRRNVQRLKTAAHRVLTADGGDSQLHLGTERAKQSRKRLPPPARIMSRLFKVLLEGQVDVLKCGAGRNQLGDAFHDREVRAMEGTFFGQVRIIAPRHEAAGIRIPMLHGNLLHHRLNGRLLLSAAERHQHGTGADGGVKPLRETATGADIQVTDQ